MPVYEVELRAFGQGAVRRVTVPDRLLEPGVCTPLALERIFYFGQNDFCCEADRAQRMPSVSVGDVIRIGNRRFVVAPVGFEEVPA